MRTITLDVPDELADQLAPLRDRFPEMLALSLHQPAVPARLYRTIIDFLADAPTAEQIASYTPSPEIEQRLRDLLDRERAGNLTPSERAELDELERIEHLMVMLKASALSSLAAS